MEYSFRLYNALDMDQPMAGATNRNALAQFGLERCDPARLFIACDNPNRLLSELT
jgi:hypothetical protein